MAIFQADTAVDCLGRQSILRILSWTGFVDSIGMETGIPQMEYQGICSTDGVSS